MKSITEIYDAAYAAEIATWTNLEDPDVWQIADAIATSAAENAVFLASR